MKLLKTLTFYPISLLMKPSAEFDANYTISNTDLLYLFTYDVAYSGKVNDLLIATPVKIIAATYNNDEIHHKP